MMEIAEAKDNNLLKFDIFVVSKKHRVILNGDVDKTEFKLKSPSGLEFTPNLTAILFEGPRKKPLEAPCL
ncbi:hypothetical protein [Ralstonia solanacearum]|uniref:hypothetical protein n=1 Tax=Ralstonia solanacearum TaxID=305 RepID=UPI0018D11B02|nr:hypothetical protein [Ralstonia solanacearum]